MSSSIWRKVHGFLKKRSLIMKKKFMDLQSLISEKEINKKGKKDRKNRKKKKRCELAKNKKDGSSLNPLVHDGSND